MKKQHICGANMAYLDQGTGHPLLMGHSYLWDANMWRPQVDTLQAHYRCIVPDLWSHGQSDPLPHSICTIKDLSEGYWQLTQTLGLKKFALIGLSVGGMWATQFALAHPEAVSALVLMDTYVGAEPLETRKVYLGMLDELEQGEQVTATFANKVAPYFFAQHTALEQPDLVENFIQNLTATPHSHIPGKIALGRATFTRTSLLDQLPKIQIPTLIIVGEEDMPRPPHEAHEMARLIPNAQIEIIPKAGHICTLEQPERVNQVLTHFLKNSLI